MKIDWWRPIKDFPKYQVSRGGVIRSFHETLTPQHGPRGRVLKGGHDKDGYRRFTLVRSDGKVRSVKLAQIVADTFIGPKPKGLVICHEDGNIENNSAKNLQYKTQKENIHDKYRHGTLNPGPVYEKVYGGAFQSKIGRVGNSPRLLRKVGLRISLPARSLCLGG